MNIDMLKQHELYPYWQVLQSYGFIVTNDEITRKEIGKILVHLAINFNKIQLDIISFDTSGLLGSSWFVWQQHCV
jgi:hypothetical protein